MDDWLNQIHLGDCLNILRQLPENSINLAVIDPPYTGDNKANSGTRYRQDTHLTKFDDMSARIWTPFMRERFLAIFDVLRPGAHFYCFVGQRMLRETMDLTEQASFKLNKVLIWDQMSVGGGYAWRNQHDFIVFASKGVADQVRDRSLSTIIRAPRVRGKIKKIHPFQKPVIALDALIANGSDEGHTVLDCFAGSGSTLVAAKMRQRNYIGIEVSPAYCEKARLRLEKIHEKSSTGEAG